MTERPFNQSIHTEQRRKPASLAETRIRQSLQAYYDAIDRGDLDTILNLFADNSTYTRGEQPEIVGKDQLRKFYEEDRIIQEGNHAIQEITVSGLQGNVIGTFTGTLKNGARIEDLVFQDRFTFQRGKIVNRITTFPGR